MELPGGVIVDGALRKSYAFGPVNGVVERAVAGDGRDAPMPDRVTAALAAALEEVGGRSVSHARVCEMSVGDRQFLVRQLAARLGEDELWLGSVCTACDSPFDFQVRQSTMPIKAAADGYPYVDVELSVGTVRMRVPNGGDQEAVCRFEDEDVARIRLLERLIVDSPADFAGAHTLSDDDRRRAEESLEAISPEVTTTVATDCPECGVHNVTEVGPYLCLQRRNESLLAEIHSIASSYHWSEAQILELPTERRRAYLRLIDLAEGVAQ